MESAGGENVCVYREGNEFGGKCGGSRGKIDAGGIQGARYFLGDPERFCVPELCSATLLLLSQSQKLLSTRFTRNILEKNSNSIQIHTCIFSDPATF